MDDSGSAFPGLAGENLKEGTHIYNLGLSRREFFAAMAMMGILANANVNLSKIGDETGPWSLSITKIADALIASLTEGGK